MHWSPPCRTPPELCLSVHRSLFSSSVLFCLPAYTRSPALTLWAVSNGVLHAKSKLTIMTIIIEDKYRVASVMLSVRQLQRRARLAVDKDVFSKFNIKKRNFEPELLNPIKYR